MEQYWCFIDRKAHLYWELKRCKVTLHLNRPVAF